jgi:hypothetical protein
LFVNRRKSATPTTASSISAITATSGTAPVPVIADDLRMLDDELVRRELPLGAPVQRVVDAPFDVFDVVGTGAPEADLARRGH